jgi:L-lactate dehydrogenase complex protein LldG
MVGEKQVSERSERTSRLSSAKEEILDRVRQALGDVTPTPPATYVPEPSRLTGAELVELFVDRLVDYKATVTRCTGTDLGQAVAAALDGAARLVVPADVPGEWLSAYPGEVVRDAGLPTADLDRADAVLTGCAIAIAMTGTIVLDAGPAQGRRALTLVPDHHVCIVHSGQVVADVPDTIARLDAVRPLTFISGPSATSDIELNRVEGVHGPRRLHVILLAGSPSDTPG